MGVKDDIPYHAGITGAVRNILAEHAHRLDIANGRIYLDAYATLWLVGED
jgi:hypothetical protein